MLYSIKYNIWTRTSWKIEQACLLCLQKLQLNCKRRFNKAVMKYFCKIYFKNFGNYRNLKIFMHVLLCRFKKLLRTRYVHGHERAHNFSSLVRCSLIERLWKSNHLVGIISSCWMFNEIMPILSWSKHVKTCPKSLSLSEEGRKGVGRFWHHHPHPLFIY